MKSNAIDNNVSERPLIIGRVNRQNTGLLYIVVRDFNSKTDNRKYSRAIWRDEHKREPG